MLFRGVDPRPTSKAPPRQESSARQRGAYSRIWNRHPFRVHGLLPGERRGTPEGALTMPRNKDLKRLVRARMSKTGESYTTARAQILAKPRARSQSSAVVAEPRRRAAAAPQPDYARLAGMADKTLKEKTGCTWARWVAALDYHGAAQMTHGEIAALVNAKYKIDGWWSQAVTVGYERIKGLRAIGQRRDGGYEANKSRTYNVPVATLF